MRTMLVAMMLVVLAGCSPSKIVESSLQPGERSTIRGAINDISRRDNGSIVRRAHPELAGKIPAVMDQMHQLLPAPPLDVSLANATWSVGGNERDLKAVYQIHGRNGWALVEASTQTTQGRTLLTSIYVQPTADDPQKLSKFTLKGAGLGQWAMLAAMAAALAITVAALVRIWWSGRFQRRWLWSVGALIGLMTVSLNWSTGAWSFQPISFQLFSVSASKQPIYAPWILAVSLPLVALVALFRRRGAIEDTHPQVDTLDPQQT